MLFLANTPMQMSPGKPSGRAIDASDWPGASTPVGSSNVLLWSLPCQALMSRDDAGVARCGTFRAHILQILRQLLPPPHFFACHQMVARALPGSHEDTKTTRSTRGAAATS